MGREGNEDTHYSRRRQGQNSPRWAGPSVGKRIPTLVAQTETEFPTTCGSRPAVNRLGVHFVSQGVSVMTDISFEDLFRQQYPLLVAVGVAALGRVDVARDLAQETMARAHVNWDKVEAADVPEAWLRRVMNNLVTDQLRRQRVEQRAFQRLASRPPPEVTMTTPLLRMKDLLAVLPERQRQVVALTYVGDLSVAEVAAALDIAPGTVKASLWKARRRLEKHLRDERST